MPNEALTMQAKAQAIYMQYLLECAKDNLKSKPALERLAFDPQGRLLVNVTLTDAQYAEVVDRINKALPPALEADAFLRTQAGLDHALGGVKTTATTTVSLDIDDPALKSLNERFHKQLFNAFGPEPEDEIDDAERKRRGDILATLGELPKGSIIPLQQEFHFHLALASRVYQSIIPTNDKKSKDDLQAEMAAAYQAAMLKVNDLVMAAYAKALEGAMRKEGTLDVAKLNKALDKARKTIAPEAHTILMKEIVKNTGVVLTKGQLKKAKERAEEITATPNDVLHTDIGQGLVTLIKGTDATAHHRMQGTNFAHRQLITHGYHEGVVSDNKNPRIQIRTPSIAVKEGLREQEYIDDVQVKLEETRAKYGLTARLSGGADGKPKAFVYNLYTALNNWTDEQFTKNLQTQSARHILQGARQYNEAQVDLLDPVFCFVQGISVNGFGDPLAYRSGDALREESTLMAEMALLHSLYDVAPKEQGAISVVMEQYKSYLRDPNKLPYFSESKEGKKAIIDIDAIKRAWQTPAAASAGDDVLANAKQSLKNLMAHDAHFSHEYSKLFQALSVFVEEASIGGCKSGNERAQSINGRVAMFDAILNSKALTSDGLEIKSALQDLASASGTDVVGKSQRLMTVVDKAYNKMGLQTAASIVSLVDQGASAKVEAKPWYFKFFSKIMSTNYGEEADAVMTNLQQTKAGSMQAHKGLTEFMKNAWEGHPKSWWARMTSNPLGKIGTAIVGILVLPVTVLVGVAVGIYTAYDNAQRKADTETMNSGLREQHEQQVVAQASAASAVVPVIHGSDGRMLAGLGVDLQHVVDVHATHNAGGVDEVDEVDDEREHRRTGGNDDVTVSGEGLDDKVDDSHSPTSEP